ncbi:hypothetical protein BDF19DRAFT_225327 [Syncephalis fuscata]|nr:hypothetical protein BDF19DRAFT_225327 [Syncephalis fuscata]
MATISWATTLPPPHFSNNAGPVPTWSLGDGVRQMDMEFDNLNGTSSKVATNNATKHHSMSQFNDKSVMHPLIGHTALMEMDQEFTTLTGAWPKQKANTLPQRDMLTTNKLAGKTLKEKLVSDKEAQDIDKQLREILESNSAIKDFYADIDAQAEQQIEQMDHDTMSLPDELSNILNDDIINVNDFNSPNTRSIPTIQTNQLFEQNPANLLMLSSLRGKIKPEEWMSNFENMTTIQMDPVTQLRSTASMPFQRNRNDRERRRDEREKTQQQQQQRWPINKPHYPTRVLRNTIPARLPTIEESLLMTSAKVNRNEKKPMNPTITGLPDVYTVTTSVPVSTPLINITAMNETIDETALPQYPHIVNLPYQGNAKQILKALKALHQQLYEMQKRYTTVVARNSELEKQLTAALSKLSMSSTAIQQQQQEKHTDEKKLFKKMTTLQTQLETAELNASKQAQRSQQYKACALKLRDELLQLRRKVVDTEQRNSAQRREMDRINNQLESSTQQLGKYRMQEKPINNILRRLQQNQHYFPIDRLESKQQWQPKH